MSSALVAHVILELAATPVAAVAGNNATQAWGQHPGEASCVLHSLEIVVNTFHDLLLVTPEREFKLELVCFETRWPLWRFDLHRKYVLAKDCAPKCIHQNTIL